MPIDEVRLKEIFNPNTIFIILTIIALVLHSWLLTERYEVVSDKYNDLAVKWNEYCANPYDANYNYTINNNSLLEVVLNEKVVKNSVEAPVG